MFDFIRKKDVWDACDKGYLEELKSKKISYQLKNAQDLGIYRFVRELRDLDIAEIGGGNSRILERMAVNNRCVNIEKFEGRGLGPLEEIQLKNVKNINAYIGDSHSTILEGSFDYIFSISVVEHVETEGLETFFRDSLRVLKIGGKFLHAIDMYLGDQSSSYNLERFECYKSWVSGEKGAVPIGDVYGGPPHFSSDMASNPDNILYGWNKMVPSLVEVRAASQSVSLIVGGVKI